MNRYLITILLCLFIGGKAFGQASGIPISTKPGLTLHIYDRDRSAPLPGAEVTLIMGKDTVRLKSDIRGETFYNRRFRTDSVEVIVSHPDYDTGTRMLASPLPRSASGGFIYLNPRKTSTAVTGIREQL